MLTASKIGRSKTCPTRGTIEGLATILSLKEAVQEYVHDGAILALEGFTHLIPFSRPGHEIIRQKTAQS